jgi:hypothetical protein
MRPRVLASALLIGSALLLAAAPTAGASDASCTGQFASTGAHDVVPFGTSIVAPEAQNPTLGGPNLGQEVKALFATADRTACPVTPP